MNRGSGPLDIGRGSGSSWGSFVSSTVGDFLSSDEVQAALVTTVEGATNVEGLTELRVLDIDTTTVIFVGRLVWVKILWRKGHDTFLRD